MHPIWSNIFKEAKNQSEDLYQILSNVPIFTGLSRRELKEFIRICHKRTYQQGEVVFWKGEPGVGMYIVQKGKVAVFAGEDPQNPEIVFATLSEGDFLGELALLDDTPRSASVVALEPSKLIGIFRPDLFSLFERKPGLGVKMLSKLAQLVGERLKFTNDALEECRQKGNT
ncbi:cyclic nucleotide-gated potassium channel [bacterium BMS3Abin05]|nr:cyclic nucleotide-gated potassium channel [bacterium BMS3Abin05]GBE28402.1 cyclic nucleotide-gated potassium channel [bacterium BMS3Bbin03]HDZ12979.1 cyclic nucleotide-binding domain-containing protein [Bacteroidota bacterium]